MSTGTIDDSFIIRSDDRVLVTGAAGFIGAHVVANLLDRGFRNVACFVRPSSDLSKLDSIVRRHSYPVNIDIIKGNLLSRADCNTACQNASVVFHLAAGTGEKSFPDAFMNSVVTTRNLLDAIVQCSCLRRFVLVSSFSVYTNRQKGRCLDESCPVEEHAELRGDAYCFAKVQQEKIVAEYTEKYGISHVILRPGSVYGPGKRGIVGRVGLGTFGLFLHLGGRNTIPFTYVDNCADAIALAGLISGIDGEVFNVVDDDLPSSRRFLRLYKENVRRFKSLYVPHVVSYALCYCWEKYAQWSEGQLPPAFNRRQWYAYWKKAHYSNKKLKTALRWNPKVASADGFRAYFQSCRDTARNA